MDYLGSVINLANQLGLLDAIRAAVVIGLFLILLRYLTGR